MPKVKNIYVITARDISTDAGDQMISIMKIIEKFGFGYDPDQMKAQGLTLGEKPVAFSIKYTIATSWSFDKLLEKDTFLTFSVSVIGPNGDNFGGPSQENLIPAGIDRVNMNFNMEGLPVTEAGKYKLLVQVLSKEGKTLADGEYPFQVELVIEPAAGKPKAAK